MMHLKIEDVIPRLRALLSGILELEEDQIECDLPFVALGADSFALIKLINDVKREFTISISMRQLFEETDTIDNLASYIALNVSAVSKATPVEEFLQVASEPSGNDNRSVIRTVLSLADEHGGRENSVQRIPEETSLDYAGAEVVRVEKLASALPSEDSNDPLRQFAEKYKRLTARSARLFANSRSVLANNRIFSSSNDGHRDFFAHPIVADIQNAARFIDVDGNEYVDLSMGFGSCFFGHRPAFIEAALAAQLSKGFSVGPEAILARDNAQLIAEITGNERVLFNNSGTEAVLTSIRIARSVTNRDIICVFQNSYHGHSDEVLARPSDLNDEFAAMPATNGIPLSNLTSVHVLPFGGDKALEHIRQNAQRIAAILVEPVQNRRPDLHLPKFLRALREVTSANGIALIFDETLVGWRIAPGGAAAHFDIEPDLTIYGKVIGGGLPIGVVAGRREYMDIVDEPELLGRSERTYTAGTFCKHPLTMAAMNAVLKKMRSDGKRLCDDLNLKTDKLIENIISIFGKYNDRFSVHNFGSFFRFSYDSNLSFVFQPRQLELLFRFLAMNGVYIWEGRTCFLSTAHSNEDLDVLLNAVEKSLFDMKTAGLLT